MRILHRKITQGYAAEMQGICILKPRFPHLLRLQKHIGRRLSVKGEGSVSVLFQADKGQCCICLIGEAYGRGINAVMRKFMKDFFAEGIISQLGNDGGVAAKSGKGAADIGRCTAHLRGKCCHIIKGTACFVRNKINQGFTDRNKLIILQDILPPYHAADRSQGRFPLF